MIKAFLRHITPFVMTAIMCIITGCAKDPVDSRESFIKGIVLDAITFEPLIGTTVTLEPTSPFGNHLYTVTDLSGKYQFEQLSPGRYSLSIREEDYEPMYARNLDITPAGAYIALLPAKLTLSTPISGITGMVTCLNGFPVAKANVAISAQDEKITNGYFSSVTTNENGHFFIGAIPLQSTRKFKIRCVAEGFNTRLVPDIELVSNEMQSVHIKLEPSSPFTNIYHEGFEMDFSGWVMNGFWHICENAELYNCLYPQYVKIAPNDGSGGKIPYAYKGKKMAWYGINALGNYIGEQSNYDYENSGGTSTAKNAGTLTSPLINLQGISEASLNFWTWFEIESVNPNKSGYDLMQVYILDSSGKINLLGKLNPYTDPIIPERRPIPFTSGGFNQAPVWKYHEYDLTQYAGTQIRLRFSFETRDGLYNGFRGWFVDDIRIVNYGLPVQKNSEAESPSLMERN
jgi:hypothetical protein